MNFEQINLQWFAAEDEGRTEDATETRLRREREEGRVAKSQELTSAIVMIMCVVALIVAAPHYLRMCEQILVYYFTKCADANIESSQFFVFFLVNFAKMVLPRAFCGVIAGIAGNLIQNRGFIFSLKPIEFKFSNIVPRIGQYLKKTVFSLTGAMNIVKSLVKIAAVIITAVVVIRMNVADILALLNTSSIRMASGLIGKCAAQILAFCSIIFLAISIPDYFMQKREFLERLKMTKQEVKQEFKEEEGDPEVKGKLQQAQRELLTRNLPKAVAESDVVITNPTHYSVALKYDAAKTDRPVVNAKGADLTAKRIRDLADENGIPRVENVPLARALYSNVEVGDIIPDTYIKAISIVYAQINYLNRKK